MAGLAESSVPARSCIAECVGRVSADMHIAVPGALRNTIDQPLLTACQREFWLTYGPRIMLRLE